MSSASYQMPAVNLPRPAEKYDVANEANTRRQLEQTFTSITAYVASLTKDPISVAVHNVLSANHGDTLTGTVVRGDLIVGNATPKWARLAVGTSGYFLKSDGTDTKWAAHGLGYGDVGAAPAAGNSSIVTVGALAAGSIVAGFGGPIGMFTFLGSSFGSIIALTSGFLLSAGRGHLPVLAQRILSRRPFVGERIPWSRPQTLDLEAQKID